MAKREGFFRDELVAAGILVPTGTDGLYGRSAIYESIVAGVDQLAVEAAASEGALSYRFPPVMPRQVLERSGYLSSFPDLIGSVSTFTGDNDDHKTLLNVAESGGEWTALLEAAGVSLCPAACHPLYPILTGSQPAGGTRYDVAGWCYRHEPSTDPFRMQAFRMHELVYLGDEAGARRTGTGGWSSARDTLRRSGWTSRSSWPTIRSSDGRVACWQQSDGRGDAEVRDRDTDRFGGASDGDPVVELPSRPLLAALRDHDGGR